MLFVVFLGFVVLVKLLLRWSAVLQRTNASGDDHRRRRPWVYTRSVTRDFLSLSSWNEVSRKLPLYGSLQQSREQDSLGVPGQRRSKALGAILVKGLPRAGSRQADGDEEPRETDVDVHLYREN